MYRAKSRRFSNTTDVSAACEHLSKAAIALAKVTPNEVAITLKQRSNKFRRSANPSTK